MSASKRRLETALLNLCTCSGGCSMEHGEHDADCPALDWMIEQGL